MSWGREGIGSKEGGGHGIDQKGSQVGELDGPPLLKSLRWGRVGKGVTGKEIFSLYHPIYAIEMED